AAIASAVLYAALIVVLALFADLIVYQGRIPAHDALNSAQAADFRKAWDAYSEDDRRSALGLFDAVLNEPEQRWRAYVWLRLRDRAGARAAETFHDKVAMAAPMGELGPGDVGP